MNIMSIHTRTLRLMAAALAVTVLGACKDPGMSLLEGVWELTAIRAGETDISFPVSFFEEMGGMINSDIDGDGEEEDILQRKYFRFSGGTLRSFDITDHIDSGDPVAEGDWPFPESAYYDSSLDQAYEQLGYTLILKEAGDDRSDVICTFTVIEGILQCVSDDGTMAFSAEERSASEISGAVDTAEE
ncbi:MAG: hypothetical protein JXB03_03320 [Spirochaetales bacterium]|nr:hypothetical protein [Spirochaetales bacterium]